MSAADSIACPRCGAKLKVKSAAVFGKTIRCPKCKEGFVAEEPTSGADDDFLGGLEEFSGDFGPPVEVYRPARIPSPELVPAAGESADERPPKKRREKSRRSVEGYPPAAWVLFGLLGGAIAGAVWVLVAYSVHSIAGYAVWLVGLFVGLGVRLAAGPRDGWSPGLTAVGVTAFVMVVARLIVSYLLASEILALVPEGDVSEQTMVLQIARQVAEEYEQKNIKLDWPNGKALADAATPDDYPEAIWTEAQTRWDAKTPDEQKSAMEQAETRWRTLHSFAIGLLFISYFHAIDVIWLGLAFFTAFKIGSGASD